MATNQSIQQSIEFSFQKLASPQTYSKALEDFRVLIQNYTPKRVMEELSNQCNQITPSNKDICFFFPLLFYLNQDQIPILTTIITFIKKSLIKENSAIYSFISKIFGKIVNELYRSTLSNEEQEESYQFLLKFCLNLLKDKDVNIKATSLLFLSEFIENCFLVKMTSNLKFLWNTLSNLLDDKQSSFKLEVINCLVSLIFITEKGFKTFACDALYKILDFLSDPDWLIRKLSVNVVYTLVFYCKNEIMPLRKNIIGLLNVLKYDNEKEIQEVCLQTLQFFQDDIINESKVTKSNSKSSLSQPYPKLKEKTDNQGAQESNMKLDCNLAKNLSDKNTKKKATNNVIRGKESTNKKICLSNTVGTNIPKYIDVILEIESETQSDSVQKPAKSRTKKKSLSRYQINSSQDTAKTNVSQGLKKDSFFSDRVSCNSKNIEDSTDFTYRLLKEKKKKKNMSMSLQYLLSKNENKILNDSSKQSMTFEHDKKNEENNKVEDTNDNAGLTERNDNNNEVLLLSQAVEKKIEELVESIKLMQENQSKLITSVNRVEALTKDKYDEFNIRLTSFEEKLGSFSATYYKEHNWGEIVTAVNQNNLIKALNLSIDNDTLLLRTIPLIKQRQLAKVPQDLIDNYLLKTIPLISAEMDIEKILSFILQVYNEKICIKSSVKKTIRDSLNDLMKNQKTNLNESCLTKIRLITYHCY